MGEVLELIYNNDEDNTILNAVKAVDSLGNEYSIIQDKISTLIKIRPRKLIVKRALIGEIEVLKGIAGEVIFSNNPQIKLEELDKFFDFLKNRKILQIGYSLLDYGIYLGYDSDKGGVVGILPFPFRDDSFEEVIIFEVLDYEIIKECHRVLKRGKRAYLVVRDKIKGGVSPILAIKVLSYRFEISKVTWKAGFWIIEGIKKK